MELPWRAVAFRRKQDFLRSVPRQLVRGEDEVERGGHRDLGALGIGQLFRQRHQACARQQHAHREHDVGDAIRALQADAWNPSDARDLRGDFPRVTEKVAIGHAALATDDGQCGGIMAAGDFFDQVHGTGVPRSSASVCFSTSNSKGERQPSFHDSVIESWPSNSEKNIPIPGGEHTEGT